MADRAYIASDGSGSFSSSSSSSRSSTTNLLFAIPLFLISLLLLLSSRRFTRLRSNIGLALCAALLGWALTVSHQGDTLLLSSASTITPINEDISHDTTKNDLIIWGITTTLFVIGSIFGATVLWPLGLAGLSVSSGFAFGLSFLLLGKDGLIPNQIGRWAWLAAWGIIQLALLAFIKPKHRHWVELAQACITGAFLFSLSIDLLANGSEGASLGLRWILDTNQAHLDVLHYDSPKLSTRLLMVLSWLIAPVLGYLQYRVFPQAQSWPSHTWFQTESESEDERTDQSPTSSQETLNGDTEKGHEVENKKDGSIWDTSVAAVPLAYSDRRTQVDGKNALLGTTQAPRHLRRPQSWPRSQSFPQPRHRASTNVRFNNRQPQRNSSAYPLPSLSQLMAYDDEQRQQQQVVHQSQGSVRLSWFIQPSTSPPPDSRGNSRRNSSMMYSRPPLPLGAHEEDHTAEEIVLHADEDSRVKAEKQAQRSGTRQEAEGARVEATSGTDSVFQIPIIQIGDGEEPLSTNTSHEGEQEDERTRKVSESTNYSNHSAVSTTSTTVTAYESIDDMNAGSLGTTAVPSSSSEDEHTDGELEGAAMVTARASLLSIHDTGDAIASSSSSDTIESMLQDSDMSRNTSGTSLSTSIITTQKAIEDGDNQDFHIRSQSPVLRTLYEDTNDLEDSGRSMKLDSITAFSNTLQGVLTSKLPTVQSIIARLTMDDWKTIIDIQASKVRSSTDGDTPESDQDTKWTFTCIPGIRDVEMQLALCAIRKEDGSEVWDNNEGFNYRITI